MDIFASREADRYEDMEQSVETAIKEGFDKGEKEKIDNKVEKELEKIRDFWNPKIKDDERKYAVLSSIYDTALAERYNYQDVVDWLYGKGAVNMDEYLIYFYRDYEDKAEGDRYVNLLGDYYKFFDDGQSQLSLLAVRDKEQIKELLIPIGKFTVVSVRIYRSPILGNRNKWFLDIKEFHKGKDNNYRQISNDKTMTGKAYDSFVDAHNDVVRYLEFYNKWGMRSISGSSFKFKDAGVDVSAMSEAIKKTREYEDPLDHYRIFKDILTKKADLESLIEAVCDNEIIRVSKYDAWDLFSTLWNNTKGEGRQEVFHKIFGKVEDPEEFVEYFVERMPSLYELGDLKTLSELIPDMGVEGILNLKTFSEVDDLEGKNPETVNTDGLEQVEEQKEFLKKHYLFGKLRTAIPAEYHKALSKLIYDMYGARFNV